MADVAKAAGVSTMTVSRALKKEGRIAPETRHKILTVVKQLGYVPDRLASSFSSQRSGFVAVLVPSLNNPHFAESVGALIETVEADGLQILLGHTNYDVRREEKLIVELLPRRPEAIVLTADAHSATVRQLLAAVDIPVIEIWDLPREPLGHTVGFSNVEAAHAMVLHLAACGYRRIAFIGESNDAGMRASRRRDGFTTAMSELGLSGHRILRHVNPPIGMTEGRQAFKEAIRRWPEIEAILCVSDPCAFGVMVEAVATGYRVPEDIGVAGFGDFEIGRCSSPSLTTVGIDAPALGVATGLLLRRLYGAKPHTREVVQLPAAILQRDSTRSSIN
jgi:LacI family transcriptional regulator, gluconate utilization system Gnt-I transcriptional repressor